MKTLNRILAATDLSEPAQRAVARAARLAGASEARLTLIHILSQGGIDSLREFLGGEAVEVEQRLIENVRAGLTRQADELARSQGVTTEIEIREGQVIAEILACAETNAADLLVLAAHGEGAAMRRLLLGATVMRLLRKTLRPVLVVRQPTAGSYRRVLLPVDFSPWSPLALDVAQAVAPEAEIVLLHAFEAPFESKLRFAGVDEATIERYQITARDQAMQQFDALIAHADLDPARVRCHARHGDAAAVILNEAQTMDCDLVVVGKHGQGVMEELFLGSVTKHVLAESDCDVLVMGTPPLRGAG